MVAETTSVADNESNDRLLNATLEEEEKERTLKGKGKVGKPKDVGQSVQQQLGQRFLSCRRVVVW